MQVRTIYLVALLLPPCAAAEPDRTSIYRGELTESETLFIEAVTCPRSLASTIVSKDLHSGWGHWEVQLACEPHDRARAHAVRELARCTGVGRDWKCETLGLEIDLPPGDWQHGLFIAHTTPERALSIYDFLEQEARKDKTLGPDELAGSGSIVWIEGNLHYWVRFTFTDWEFSYHVTERCGKHGCRRKLTYDGMYQSPWSF